MRLLRWLALTVLLSIILVGCGATTGTGTSPEQSPAPPDDTAQQTDPSEEPSPTAEPAPTPEPSPAATAEPSPPASPEPALSDDNAPPTPVPAQEETRQPSQPVRIEIPAIEFNEQPVAVGLDENRVPVVPKHDVGWYQLGAMPGQGDNVVFWGHVLRWLDASAVPAPFARVEELTPGAEVNVYTANGDVFRYQVTEAVQVRPDQVEYILPTGGEQVTLVSCIGDNVIVDGTLTKEFRLVTIAKPVQ